MIQTRYKILNWSLMALLMTLFCGAQTSLWYQFTGGAPAPQFWLIFLLHFTLYRRYITALVGIYILAATILKSYSAVPLGVYWSVLLITVSIASFIKTRMFWSNSRFFVIATAAFVTLYHVTFYIVSHSVEENPTPVLFFTRVAEVFLTTLCAYPMFWFLQAVDRWTLREVVSSNEVAE